MAVQSKIRQRRVSNGARAAIASAKRSYPDLELGHLSAAALASFSHSEVRAIESAIGLQQPNPEFREAIADAVMFCACLHAFPSKRYADIRKELIEIQKRADRAASAIAALGDVLNTSARGEVLKKRAPPLCEVEFRSLGALAGDLAAALVGKDIGGRPRMRAFDGLIRLLADAFSRATGRPAAVTWHEHRQRFEGRFCTLVDAVVPKAAAIAAQSGRPLEQPKGFEARGGFIKQALRRMDKT